MEEEERQLRRAHALAASMPALHTAREAVAFLRKNDLDHLKRMNSPPIDIAHVTELVLKLLGEKELGHYWRADFFCNSHRFLLKNFSLFVI